MALVSGAAAETAEYLVMGYFFLKLVDKAILNISVCTVSNLKWNKTEKFMFS